MRKVYLLLLALVCLLASCGSHPAIAPDLPDVIVEEVDDPGLSLQHGYIDDTDNAELSAEPSEQLGYSISVGVPLDEEEQMYYGKALVNAINHDNYFYGEYSDYWPLNDFGKTEVDVYERLRYRTWSRDFCFVIKTLEKHHQWPEGKDVFAIWLALDTVCGKFMQYPFFSYWYESMDDAIEFLAESKVLEGDYLYLGSIIVEIPSTYPPEENMDYFDRVEDLFEDFKRAGIRQGSLYIGIQYHDCTRLGDNWASYYKGDIVTTVSTEFCLMIEEKLYYTRVLTGHTNNPDDPLPRLLITGVPGPLYYREPENAKEAFLLEQIVKLGNVHEFTE